MASTAAASRLTESHRQAQARIGARAALDAVTAFRVLDVGDLDGSFAGWLQVMTALIGRQRTQSARLAANYLLTFRSIELGVDTTSIVPSLAEEIDTAKLATSLLVCGPASIRANLARNVPERRALDLAKTRVAGAAMRHVLNGGRDTITDTVGADAKALGWARATSGKACHFCAMVASRGPVYSERTVRFEAHDHCSCSAEPVYRQRAPWPAGAERYRAMWDEATAGLSGADARNAFRLALGA